jgi:hypothetical protein
VDDLTKRRLTHNEELFRQVNEAREESASPDDLQLTLICECADQACTGRIKISTAEYRRIRESESRYVVLPDHVIPALERVVVDRGSFEIVEKDAA